MKFEKTMEFIGYLFLLFGIWLRFSQNLDLFLIFEGAAIMMSVIVTSLIRISEFSIHKNNKER